MAKHLTSQRFVFKVHTSRLRRAKWDLTLTIDQARENKELIALAESQLMRFIDELNGVENVEEKIRSIKSEIKHLRHEKDFAVAKPKIKRLYKQLDDYQFKKDYVCVVIDSNKDYQKIYKSGFKINGIKYKRFLGTTGGVKTNTIVFVNEKLYPELKKRMDNGRDPDKEFTPAKLEAYNALICSSSTPVSMPHGVIVVNNCVTHFGSEVIELNDEDVGEPVMKHLAKREMELIDSDGYGLGMPELLERWGHEIGEDYMLPACVIRNAFCKGAVFPIDFHKFAADRGITTITDIWGEVHNVEDVELVLTESMLKLWDSYSSIEDYLSKCEENHYTFAISKTSEKELENVRTMNYQFLQSYEFTDEEIDELIAPTVDEIKDILSDDYRKTILYVKGMGLNSENVKYLDNNFTTALMIEPEMRNDPYVVSQIKGMISKRIDDAKIGVLKVPANYSFVSGDPYSLCQSMLGLEVTGLLKSGEVYSKYWADHGVKQIVSFRAPMTSHNNIRRMNVVHSEEMDEFYKYMTTPTIFNSWDTCADAMNGFDKDGDCVINTSFPLLVKRTVDLPAVVCVQRKAPKCVPTEDDIVDSNIRSFGNAIGEITNRITSMFEVQARFPKDSREYEVLDYRIKCGQLYQQNQIDKTKGIEAKDMPESWYKWSANKIPYDDDNPDSKENQDKLFNRRILADKKPYFFKYVYPTEKRKYDDYQKKNDEKCLMRFRIPLKELLGKENRTEEEQKFVDCYYERIPVGMAPCTINRICWRVEEIFDDVKYQEPKEFDYSIMKSKDGDYDEKTYNEIVALYAQYKKELADYMRYAKAERVKSEDRVMQKYLLAERFRRECSYVCPDENQLCNIVLDICYPKSNASKQFAWDMCGEQIIQNLLKRNNYVVSYPTKDPDGDIEFGGEHFKMETIDLSPEETEVEETEWESY